MLPDSCTCAYMLADPYLVSDWLSLWRQAFCKAVCVRIVVETFSLKVRGNQSRRSWLAVNESHSISSSLTHCPSYFPHPPGLALLTWTWLIDRLFLHPFRPPQRVLWQKFATILVSSACCLRTQLAEKTTITSWACEVSLSRMER